MTDVIHISSLEYQRGVSFTSTAESHAGKRSFQTIAGVV